ncbi:MAG: helix-turn-helix transcriptional regulator [Blastocatellia bacterium]
MGTARRPRPTRLATKLKEVRSKLDLTQEQMVKKLTSTKIRLKPGHISEYESDKREPPLPVLLQYARLAGVPMEVLVDDDLDLPDRLPTLPEHSIWIMKRVKISQQH